MWLDLRCDGPTRLSAPAPVTCSQLLFRYDSADAGSGFRFEIKCPRCRRIRVITLTDERSTVQNRR